MQSTLTDRSFYIASLVVKHLQDDLTKAEETELVDWINTSEQNKELFDELSGVSNLEEQLAEFGKTDIDEGWRRVQYKLEARKNDSRRIRFTRWRVAAAVLVLGVIGWQLMQRGGNNIPPKPTLISEYGEDILPGTAKAQLFLSDGSTISLDNKNDTVFAESGTAVHRMSDGTIKYDGRGYNAATLTWNTIRIPNGGEYRILLDDGTRVWLNAASSLRYPVQFTGNERRVELLEGEAYFEVAKNKEKPFIVVTGRMQVQAVGTAFNVNRYPLADSSINTTLTEGRIKVSAGNAISLLEPGQQIIVDKQKVRVTKADVEAVTAWKNGLFIFNSEPLERVMEQMARWYDVTLVYDSRFKEHKLFTGEIKRNVPVSKLLHMMELTGIAKFRITNNTITILPYSP